jgi:diacylglycerol kinase (ATP)
MRPETLVIVNPIAGGGRAGRVQSKVRDYLMQRNHPADFIESRGTGDLREQAEQAAAAGYRKLVALGGDGAFHHMVEGAFGADVTLGFFPAGNGNDIAAALGIPRDPIEAVHAFLKSQPRRVDVIRVRFADGNPTSQAMYIGAGGMGLDAEAAHLANTRFKRWPGVTRYIAGAFRALRNFEPFEIELDLDGRIERERAIFVAVANGPCYGSGIRIAPDACVDDGLLEVTLVHPIPWTRLVEAFPLVLRSGDIRWPEIRRFRGCRVAMRPDRSALVHGDGEILGRTPAEFEVLPGAIRMIAPATSE